VLWVLVQKKLLPVVKDDSIGGQYKLTQIFWGLDFIVKSG
jgi:hypothetical protein